MMDGAGIAKEPAKQDGEVRRVGGGPAWLCSLGQMAHPLWALVSMYNWRLVVLCAHCHFSHV